ncbi:MAG TPA: LLM class F420-dependent oxidoreductase [Myxococcota bacterium]|jgi:probable F420-dependent oxidoreductase
MRFSGQLATDQVGDASEWLAAPAIGELARALEQSGFDAAYATEHPFPPDAWLRAGGHHALDPFVALAVAGAATQRLRLHTNILVLPYRNPFLMAKAVASLDLISGGRVILGVAAGYLEGEYRALGADFERRNELADDALLAIKLAWSGESVERDGPGYRAIGNRMLPRPVQRPHPPIWIGGNSRRAARRAAEHGQGWSPFPVKGAFGRQTRTAPLESIEELAARIRELRDHAHAIGRSDPLDVNFVPFGLRMNPTSMPDPDAFCEQVVRLAEIGVSWLSIGLPCPSRAGYREHAARFGEQVIARIRRG